MLADSIQRELSSGRQMRKWREWRDNAHPAFVCVIDWWTIFAFYTFRWLPWFLSLLSVFFLLHFVWAVSNRVGLAFGQQNHAHEHWLLLCQDPEEVRFNGRSEMCERLNDSAHRGVILTAFYEELYTRGWCATDQCTDFIRRAGISMLFYSVLVVVVLFVVIVGGLLLIERINTWLLAMQHVRNVDIKSQVKPSKKVQ